MRFFKQLVLEREKISRQQKKIFKNIPAHKELNIEKEI